MARLKTLTQEEFTLLYNYFSYAELSELLKISFNPIMRRAKQYGLPAKTRGRMPHKIQYRDEEVPAELQVIIDKVLKDDAIIIENEEEHKYLRDIKKRKL